MYWKKYNVTVINEETQCQGQTNINRGNLVFNQIVGTKNQ